MGNIDKEPGGMYICYVIIRETLNISAVGEASGNRYISDLHFGHDDMIAFDKQEVSFLRTLGNFFYLSLEEVK